MLPRRNEYFPHVRDSIQEFINRRPDGSRIQLFGVTDYNYKILDITKSNSSEIWSKKLLELKPGDFEYSHNGTVSSVLLNANLKDCFDHYQGLTQISVLIGPSTTMGVLNFKKLTFKSFVIQTDVPPSKDSLVTFATNLNHVFLVSESDELNKLIAEDTEHKCNTDKYWRSDFNTCESCKNKCSRASLTCENQDLAVECKYQIEEWTRLKQSTAGPTTSDPWVSSPFAQEPEKSPSSGWWRYLVWSLGGTLGVATLVVVLCRVKGMRRRREMTAMDGRPNEERGNDHRMLPDNRPVTDTQPHDDRLSREARPYVDGGLEVQREETQPLMKVADAIKAAPVHNGPFLDMHAATNIQPCPPSPRQEANL
ncbi:hypothetical protein MAR_027104 [Mya arenaria]|uniref:Uncharacterized protein n=2 Tax=Mya arenaria TaxID=6604 RepID=A0ABY7EVE2_MYAAR|nr:uncharacterized protein LOC128243499 isoform X2 [Mya arenaria]WAR12924.1 hypothetical protein MAR_027104 [Mya arenaria]